MTYYQPTVTIYKYSWLKGKWVYKEIMPSTLIFESWSKAESYKYDFIEGLKRRGVKLIPGNYKIHNAQLIIEDK